MDDKSQINPPQKSLIEAMANALAAKQVAEASKDEIAASVPCAKGDDEVV